MNARKLFYCICIIQVWILLSCNPQTTLINDRYNLNFESDLGMFGPSSSWMISGTNSWKIVRDTIQFKEGKASAKIEVFTAGVPGIKPLHLSQLLRIPQSAKKIDISLWMKCDQLSSGQIKILTFDSKERQSDGKIVPLTSSKEWNKVSFSSENKAGQMLYIEFEIKDNSTIWLDNLNIKFDDKDIYDCISDAEKNSNVVDSATINPSQIKPISTDIQAISTDFDKKSVIGIGESCQGVHEIAEFRNQLITELITNKKCKLVIFEAPDLLAERLNAFVQGSLSEEMIFTSDDKRDTQFFNLSHEMLSLLKWIKQYNEKATQKVVIAGMDVSSESNRVLPDEIIAQLGKEYYFNNLKGYFEKSESDSLVAFMNKNKDAITSKIGKPKFESIYAKIKSFQRFTAVYSPAAGERSRDSVMAVNITELCNKYISNDEKMVICGHLSHLNKLRVDNSVLPSVGSYLSHQFNDSYFVVGILVNQGDYQAQQYPNSKLNTNALALPQSGSLEYLAAKLSNSSFYMKIPNESPFKDKIMLTRSIGGLPQNQQFFPGNPSLRYDAIVYLNQGTPLHLLPLFQVKNK